MPETRLILRGAIVIGLALAGTYQVVRSATADHYIVKRVDLAERAWSAKPSVAIAVSMRDIGRSAAEGGVAPAASVARSMIAARRAPLFEEPFLIKGTMALADGRPAHAERLFAEARRRDPRSSAARYFLAMRYFATGRPREGIEETSVLTKLVSGGSDALVPALVQYAREPGAVPNLRRVLAVNRPLRDAVLASLARDADNSELVMALAGTHVSNAQSDAAPLWQAELIKSMVARGEFVRAHRFWLRLSGLSDNQPYLFNPDFTKVTALPPFNWSLISSDAGVAERGASGGLQIIYYGRTDADFASQLVLLASGSYELRMKVTREADTRLPSGLGWTITCHGTRRLLQVPVGGGAGTPRALIGRFTVPADCPAQMLTLSGSAREFAEGEQALFEDLELVKLAGH